VELSKRISSSMIIRERKFVQNDQIEAGFVCELIRASEFEFMQAQGLTACSLLSLFVPVPVPIFLSFELSLDSLLMAPRRE